MCVCAIAENLFPKGERLLVEEHIANIGITLDILDYFF